MIRRVIDELGARECVAGYGLSEASPNVAQSAWWEPEEVRASGAMAVEPGVEVRIRDFDDRRDCEPGEPGAILVRGWNVMQGYLDDPVKTAEAISPDGWLSTGDIGSLDTSGRLHFSGRTKEIIRVGGENVAPADIEDVLHRHPRVPVQGVLDVRGRDVFPADADDVLGAAGEVEPPRGSSSRPTSPVVSQPSASIVSAVFTGSSR